MSSLFLLYSIEIVLGQNLKIKGGWKMNTDYKKFEMKWILIFGFMYILVMMPFPFFYSERYIPSIKGIPLFLIGWIIHTLITFVLIYIYSKKALSRKEYQESYYMGEENRDE